MQELSNASKKQSQVSVRLREKVDSLDGEIARLNGDIDRLEAFSRRDNLRFFGIPEENIENYDSCVRSVCNVLNSVEGPKTWSPDDFVRAHRLGKSRDGEPKPMIVKFAKWKDKMTVISNRAYRDRLQKTGIRVANDLTRNQARIATEARKEGKVAFFKGGKMVVGPKQPDNRSYAEVTASASPPSNRTITRQATHQQLCDRQRTPEGNSPFSDNNTGFTDDTQRSPARESRASASNCTSSQPGIRQYCEGGGMSRLPVNSSPRQHIRRSERNSNAKR